MTTLTSSLIVRLIDQVSAPARKVSKALLGLNNEAKGGFAGRLGAAMERNNRAMAAVRGSVVDAAAGLYLLKNAISGPVRAAMDFESAMADVRKVVDFPTPEAFTAFKDDLIALSKVVPLSVNGLAQIAAAAGQAGIAREDILRFTEAAAKVGVAFDISADQAGDALAKLMTGLGITVDEAVRLTDAMNHLSNSQASSAEEILDVVRRVGAQAKLYGFTAEQTAAFASAMISAGAESEVAATSFRNMGMALTRGESATKRQRNALKELGLSATDVAERMQEDAVGTTIDVLERLSKLPAAMQGAIASDLFGNEARALGPLLTNLDLVRSSIGLVSNEADYAGSAFKEFEVRSKTFANAVEVFNNRLTALGITIGNALIPALTDLMNTIAPVIEKIAEFAQAHPELTRNVAMAAAALIGFKVATASLSFVGLLGKGGALSMLSLGFNTVGRAIIGASNAAKNAVGLQAALAGLNGANFGNLAKIGVALRGITLAVPGVAALSSAFAAVGAALATITAPVWAGIVAAVVAIAAAGFSIWKYWDRISSVVGGVFARVGEEFAPALKAAQPIIDAFAAAGRVIADGFGVAKAKLQEFAGWIGSFFQREVLSDEDKAAFSKGGYDLADAMIQSIKNAFQGLLDWFTSLPGKIVEAIGKIDLSGIIQWPTLPGWMGGGSAPATNNPSATINGQVDPGLPVPGTHRAHGGPVTRGRSVIVGDGGEPEIFTPPGNGRVTPMSRMGGNAQGVQSVTFHIYDARDPDTVVRKVSDALNRLARGAHSDSEAWT